MATQVKEASASGLFEALIHESCQLMCASYRIEQTYRPFHFEYLCELRSVRALAHAGWIRAMLNSR
jgi:hypothetical protein